MSNESNALVTRTERARKLVDTLQGKRENFERALVGRLDPDRFIQIIANAYLGDSKLQECSVLSIYAAALEAAEVGLKVDGEEAALVGYRDREEGEVIATFQPMYQGLVRLMLRAGALKVESRTVRSGDHFRFRYGLDPLLEHTPASSGERGDYTHAYAIVWLPGRDAEGRPIRQFEVMDLAELEKARSQSKAPQSPAWRNFTGEMYRKVVVRRLRKYVELDSEASAAFRKEELLERGHAVPLGELDPRFEHRCFEERAASHARREVAALADAARARTAEEDPAPQGEEEPAGDAQAQQEAAQEPDPEPEGGSESAEDAFEKPEGESVDPLRDFSGMELEEIQALADAFPLEQEVPSGKYKGSPWGAVVQEDPEYIDGVIKARYVLEEEDLRKLAADLHLRELGAESDA